MSFPPPLIIFLENCLPFVSPNIMRDRRIRDSRDTFNYRRSVIEIFRLILSNYNNKKKRGRKITKNEKKILEKTPLLGFNNWRKKFQLINKTSLL